ncbi:MAG TPA: FCD domain-containing protein [Pseudomonas xinjiangensis]|uniref:Pyruvate dehydrogenase complex repressor n=2 Tax=root TaxID=1 RepID=A0A7V1BKP0_9GAMM|nr:FCD domain-containing protein [Halopseudomonas xinjiangensis]HEC46008.1 FCD domain-containing protein [Halopseudomonas xinjiangensis]
MEVGSIKPQRLSDTIVAQLESMILEGALKAGERLPAERVLAERFGVSRPSLREAMQKMVAQGLLVSRQGGGNYVAENLGSSFRDPLLGLLERRPEAHRDLLEFRHTLETSCAYHAAQRATEMDLAHLTEAYQALQACYAPGSTASPADEGAADARFHLAIAEASHNTVLLHTIRGLFDLLKRNVVTNIGGMYALRGEARSMLSDQHQQLYRAIMEGRADDARTCASQHLDYVQEVLAQSREQDERRARSQRRSQSFNTSALCSPNKGGAVR